MKYISKFPFGLHSTGENKMRKWMELYYSLVLSQRESDEKIIL